MEHTDMYLTIFDQTIDSISLRCNCDKEELTLKTETEAVTKGNLGLFGHILLDLHEQYGVPITYKEFTQYELFPTVESVVNHFFNNIEGGVFEDERVR